jgi:hypothetical protein
MAGATRAPGKGTALTRVKLPPANERQAERSKVIDMINTVERHLPEPFRGLRDQLAANSRPAPGAWAFGRTSFSDPNQETTP